MAGSSQPRRLQQSLQGSTSTQRPGTLLYLPQRTRPRSAPPGSRSTSPGSCLRQWRFGVKAAQSDVPAVQAVWLVCCLCHLRAGSWAWAGRCSNCGRCMLRRMCPLLPGGRTAVASEHAGLPAGRGHRRRGLGAPDMRESMRVAGATPAARTAPSASTARAAPTMLKSCALKISSSSFASRRKAARLSKIWGGAERGAGERNVEAVELWGCLAACSPGWPGTVARMTS